MLSALSTQFRPTQTRNTEFLPFPAPKERIPLEPKIPSKSCRRRLYTTQYTKRHRTLSGINVSQCGTHSYLMGPLSRLVDRPPVEPSLSKDILPLITAANGPNGAISLTQTFNRISFHFCNRQYFGEQKAKNGERGTIVLHCSLKRK